MRILVPRTFIPKEAESIASRFAKIAQELDAIASQVNGIAGSLNNTWEGKAKNKFSKNFDNAPGNLRATADYCRDCQKRIRNISVTLMEWKEVDG
jgi:WXG100 family type VII secretion target